jgi:lipopolysaccharide biosynthesis glycosyltransferase
MNIVCATDGNYLPHCVIMLETLRKQIGHLNPSIFLIHHSADSNELIKAFAYLQSIYSSISFLPASVEKLRDFPVSGHGSVAAYLKLMIPDILPFGLDKVLFIDSDTVVVNRLSDLWAMDLKGKSLAAVGEHKFCCLDHGYEHGEYFNSGVMLIDLGRWRESKIVEKGLVFAKENPHRLRHWDQDVLNAVFQGDWLAIDERWNACPHLFGLNGAYDLSPNSLTESENTAIKNPAIVHFAGPGPLKPWHASCTHPYKQVYLNAKSTTPWKLTPLLNAPQPKWTRLRKKIMSKLAAKRILPDL